MPNWLTKGLFHKSNNRQTNFVRYNHSICKALDKSSQEIRKSFFPLPNDEVSKGLLNYL